MKTLVTGATGFIGGKLVERLLKDNWQVIALVRRTSNILELKKRNARLVFGDISDLDSVKKAVKGVSIVFNLAAALPYHNLPDKKYQEANVEGVKNLMEVCKKEKVKRVVHISTVGVYGTTSRYGANEKSPFKLSDIYSRTKAEGEKIVWEYIKRGLPATIIRPTIGYGPGDTRPGFLSLFVYIKKGLFVPVGKGGNFFHTVYIDNLVDALMLAATKKAAVGQDFIIGDEPCPTMKEIAETIAKVENKKLPRLYLPLVAAYPIGLVFDVVKKFGLPTPLSLQRVRFITENKKFGIEKAKKMLGYKPKMKLGEGVKKTFEWYKEEGYI